jgi:phosphohistidine phosphatase
MFSMPCLLLLRHGKSAWPDGVDDLERPLAKRGREASRRMGRYLADEGLVPDLALVSPARRTQETWTLAQDALGDVAMRAEPRIYEAPPDRLLTVLKGVEPDIGTLLMVGHNPGLEELLRLLVRDEDRYARAPKKYPTAGLAVIEVPARAWRELSPRSARLLRFVTPRTLGAGEDE